MTANQLTYWKNQEEIRHNKEDEQVKSRQATAAERQADVAKQKADLEEKKFKWDKTRDIQRGIHSSLDEFGLTPQSSHDITVKASTAFKNVFGSLFK